MLRKTTHLRDEVVALVAPDTINVATAGLVASSVSSLLGHSIILQVMGKGNRQHDCIRSEQKENTVSFKLVQLLQSFLLSALILRRIKLVVCSNCIDTCVL